MHEIIDSGNDFKREVWDRENAIKHFISILSWSKQCVLYISNTLPYFYLSKFLLRTMTNTKNTFLEKKRTFYPWIINMLISGEINLWGCIIPQVGLITILKFKKQFAKNV